MLRSAPLLAINLVCRPFVAEHVVNSVFVELLHWPLGENDDGTVELWNRNPE